MMSDKELLEQYRRGDMSALEQFYRRYKDGLYSYLCTILGAESVAADLLQEIFTEIIKRVDSLDVIGEMRPYLYTAARNKAISVLRNEKAKARCIKEMLSIELISKNHQSDPLKIVIRSEEAHKVNSALMNLPQDQREVIMLRIYP